MKKTLAWILALMMGLTVSAMAAEETVKTADTSEIVNTPTDEARVTKKHRKIRKLKKKHYDKQKSEQPAEQPLY